MMRVGLLICLISLAGCRDWNAFSENYDGGAGGGASGTGGGGTGGGGLDPSSCDSRGEASCPAGTLFCDNFPSTTLNAAWTVEQMNGTVAVSGDCKYRGDYALHAHLSALGANVAGRADVFESASGEPLPGNQFVRVMVRVNSPVPAMPIRLVELRQPSPGTNEVRLVYSAGQLSVSAVSGDVPSATAAFPLDQWVCVEWQLEEGTPGTARVWLNGESSPAIEGALGASDLKSVVLGAVTSDHAAAVDATDAWFDEVVVSANRAGCP
jgi:hypothetical protein